MTVDNSSPYIVNENAGPIRNPVILSYNNFGAVLVLHIPNIKYIFEIYLGIICVAVGKNGKENIEGLKIIQLNTIIVTLLYSTLLDDLPVKSSILLDFICFIAE